MNDLERKRLLLLAHEANTYKEMEQAIAALRLWVQTHPEDWGIRDAFELLSHRKEFLEAQVKDCETEVAILLA